MPKRNDIKKILVIGSGPIIIGQGCEFDYSGSQACRALKEEGYEIILLNSNPATIMTDPDMADKVFMEPLTEEVVVKIIEKTRPDSLLPTLGGQTALNISVKLDESGILKKYGVCMLGAKAEVIRRAEDRQLFKESMYDLGLDVPRSCIAGDMREASRAVCDLGYPVVIRPCFTLGGTGGGIAYDEKQLNSLADEGFRQSPISKILIEESVEGWKEYELEVMRDVMDNVVVICSIENMDPMGIHTGDSITVAPAQTLSDKEYQKMRDWAIRIIRKIGVDTGGSNIQFAVSPDSGRMIVIEMNPRVSRSSALASKATGFPIAKIAAKLAVGYTLDEIPNDITRKTPASFEPALDYVVTKIPRFTFEKFLYTDHTLNTSMKSIGEVMAIGRTFKESLQKALRGLEIGRYGLGADGRGQVSKVKKALEEKDDYYLKNWVLDKIKRPNCDRIFNIKYAIELGMDIKEIKRLSGIDIWFIEQIRQILEMEQQISGMKDISKMGDLLRQAKEYGFSDYQIAYMTGKEEREIRSLRLKFGILPVYKQVDTCAAEFEAYTPYCYSTYEKEDETVLTEGDKILIIGGGPNRIGQGIEFDYCCCHACFALREEGYKTIMVNSNPETVSTDYDISDRLYFEPLTFEDVLNVIEKERPIGVIVQFGGQTPLNLALPLMREGVRILGTSPEDIDRAENRERFREVLAKLGFIQPENDVAVAADDVHRIARRIGYPVVVRPSYVIGGRAIRVIYEDHCLSEFMADGLEISRENPVLIDKFIEDAIEIDVDAVSDGKDCIISGIMEHIEEAGIHSGDSACVIPPYSLSSVTIGSLKEMTLALAKELKVVGLMNVQYAIKDNRIYVLEVNPRASRTVPYVSKATGVQWAKIATKVMTGRSLAEMGIREKMLSEYFAVKEAVFPFSRFGGVDPVLSAEMRSTGEVMGIDSDFGNAFVKSQTAAGNIFPKSGNVFISVKDRDKRDIVFVAKRFKSLGFAVFATPGTAGVLKNGGMKVDRIIEFKDGGKEIADLVRDRKIGMIINTPSGSGRGDFGVRIRRIAVMNNIPLITTLSGAKAAINGLDGIVNGSFKVRTLREYYEGRV